MNTTALITAQLHRNPELLALAQEARTRRDSRRPIKRDRRRRL